MDLMHECFPKHLRLGTASLEEDKQPEEEDKLERVKMETSLKAPVARACHPPGGSQLSETLDELPN